MNPDGGGPTVACDPVFQTGCAENQRCAHTPDDSNPLLDQVACISNEGGLAQPGQPCTLAADGTDNCARVGSKGYQCLNDTCIEICENSGANTNSCEANLATPDSKNCVGFAGLFTEFEDVGLCIDACEAVDQVCPIAGDACYLDLFTGDMSCAEVPTAASSLDGGAGDPAQGKNCVGPQANSCFLNGCPKGYGAVLPANAQSPQFTCAYFCNPVNTHTGAVDNPQGDPAGTSCADAVADGRGSPPIGDGAAIQCRYLQSFFNLPNSGDIPTTVGMCVDTANWGDCTTCDITNTQTFVDTCTGPQNDNNTENDINAFGCVDLVTLLAIPQPPAAASGKPTGPTTEDLLRIYRYDASKMGIDLTQIPGWQEQFQSLQ